MVMVTVMLSLAVNMLVSLTRVRPILFMVTIVLQPLPPQEPLYRAVPTIPSQALLAMILSLQAQAMTLSMAKAVTMQLTRALAMIMLFTTVLIPKIFMAVAARILLMSELV